MPTHMEELASKAMGAFKAAKASIKGLDGVFKVLAEEHGEVTALLMRVKMSSDTQVRRDLFPKIRAELLGHEKGELREVYPEFEKRPELAPLAKDHSAEATQLEQLLDRLHTTAFDDPAWTRSFDDLVDLVKHHVDEEENEFFPAGVRVLGKAEAERLEAPYKDAKAAAMRAI